MPQRVLAAKLEFYDPASGALRTTLTTKLRSFEIEEEAGSVADDARFSIRQDGASPDDYRAGDEVRAYVKTDTDGSLVHLWTGVVDSIANARDNQNVAMRDVRAQDYVYWTLAHAYITEIYENMDAGAIARDIVARSCPRLTATSATVENTGITIPTIVFNGENVLAALRKLAELADADIRGDKNKTLYFYPIGTKSSGFSVTPNEVIQGSFKVERSMAGFGNVQSVFGGYRSVLDQTSGGAFSSFSTVTYLTRKKVRVFVTKSPIASVDIWTDPTGFTGDLIVRVQADNSSGTAPVAETNPDNDLAQATVLNTDLTVGGWTNVPLPPHIVSSGNFVWLIVQSSGSQRVGLDASNVLKTRTYYQIPILAELQDVASISTYGRHELQPLYDTNIVTEDDALLVAAGSLGRHAQPIIAGSYECQDMTLSNVLVGQTVKATFTADGIASNTALVIHRKHMQYDADRGSVFTLTHDFTDAYALQTAEDVLLKLYRQVRRLEDAQFGRQKDALVNLIRSTDETAKVSDTVSQTTDTTPAATAVVETALVGYACVQ